MRVLVFGMSGSLLGGIETFLLNMNAKMSNDCVFDYIIQGNGCIHQNAIEQKGGKIFFVPPIKSSPIEHFKQLAKIFKENRKTTNVAYFNQFSMAYPIPIWMAKHYGYKVIMHAHNNGLQSKSHLYVMLHNIGKLLLQNKAYIRWTNSRISADYMFGKGKEAELIYNAIDVERFRFDEQTRVRVRNENKANSTVIGFIGRLAYQKNPVFMVRVFAKILQKIPDAVLWIIGEGELQADMENEMTVLGITENVRWLGRRNNVNELMCGMDLLLQPSNFEGLGIVLVEGQASGVPCVTSAKVVPEEVNISSLMTFISLDETADEWGNRCIEALKSHSKLERVKCSESVLESNFNIAREAPRLENMLVKIETYKQ